MYIQFCLTERLKIERDKIVNKEEEWNMYISELI
jgi:hypothetical protein